MDYLRVHIPVAAIAFAGAFTNTAAAQPLVGGIGEPSDAAERASDLTLLQSGEITFVGDIRLASNSFIPQVYVGVADPDGVPIVSFIIDDAGNQDIAGYAIREDTADRNFVVLHRGDQLHPVAGDEMVLSKLDPFASRFVYQHRFPMYDGGGFTTGMELGDQGGFIASANRTLSGVSRPTLLRFDTMTGSPSFYTLYFISEAQTGDAWFVDVASSPDAGDIFAVGTIQTENPGFSPGFNKLLVARFDALGNPIWLNAYDAVVPDANSNSQLGLGIELDDIHVVVNAQINGVAGGSATLTLVLDPEEGTPVTALSLDASSQGIGIQPAASSLELLPGRSALQSGTIVRNAGDTTAPAMWSVNPFTGEFDWAWAPDRAEGFGFSAIPQSETDLLLVGETNVYPGGPIGNLPDVFLARAINERFGPINRIEGLCPLPLPLPIETFHPQILVQSLQVSPLVMPGPARGNLQLLRGEPAAEQACTSEPTCPGEFSNDGFRDTADLLILLANFNTPGGVAQGDANSDALINTADLLILLAAFNTPCP